MTEKYKLERLGHSFRALIRDSSQSTLPHWNMWPAVRGRDHCCSGHAPWVRVGVVERMTHAGWGSAPHSAQGLIF
uniref:Uncharacterized protein n=1 Tax=Knipowitschia caucasica TaxID=637954 RepID=A0AAV2KJA7_KNICA